MRGVTKIKEVEQRIRKLKECFPWLGKVKRFDRQIPATDSIRGLVMGGYGWWRMIVGGCGWLKVVVGLWP